MPKIMPAYIDLTFINNYRNKKSIERQLSSVRPGTVKWFRLVKITAIILFAFTNPAFAGSEGLALIGNKAYDILLDISFWYAIIGCGLDLLKCSLNGTTNNMGRVVMNYILIYASIALLPKILTMVKGVLK
ncbi:MAG: hypothetical protein ACRCR2_03770 [Fusobacteriaceae bacterium]